MLGGFFDDSFFSDAAESRLSAAAKTDIHETEKAFVVSIDLPGFKKEDLNIEVSGANQVHVSGKRQTARDEKEAKCHLRERQTMEFSRTFRLPKEVQSEAVGATFEAGVLELTLPKLEQRTPDKVKIAVK